MITGQVFGLERSSFKDGPGMRTVVFLSGCAMRCFWCHNPEGLTRQPRLLFYENRCTNCRSCEQVCPNHVHSFDKGHHIIDRDKCSSCGQCVENCLYSALEISCHGMTDDDIINLLNKDKPFFSDGGGLTLSGGEPLLQSDFVLETFRKCRQNNISTALETALNVKKEVLEAVLPLTDHFLVDLKHIKESEHIKGTGVSLKPIIENIRYLNENKPFVLRIPVIPSFNEDYIPEMADFVNTLENVEYVQLMPFHVYGISKYNALNIDYKAKNLKEPDKQELMSRFAHFFKKKTII